MKREDIKKGVKVQIVKGFFKGVQSTLLGTVDEDGDPFLINGDSEFIDYLEIIPEKEKEKEKETNKEELIKVNKALQEQICALKRELSEVQEFLNIKTAIVEEFRKVLKR